jgi:hypothetical protein
MKKTYIVTASLVATFVTLVVLFQGNLGAASVVFAILLFGAAACAMTSVPAKSSRLSEREHQALIDYNRIDCEATSELTHLHWGS